MRKEEKSRDKDRDRNQSRREQGGPVTEMEAMPWLQGRCINRRTARIVRSAAVQKAVGRVEDPYCRCKGRKRCGPLRGMSEAAEKYRPKDGDRGRVERQQVPCSQRPNNQRAPLEVGRDVVPGGPKPLNCGLVRCVLAGRGVNPDHANRFIDDGIEELVMIQLCLGFDVIAHAPTGGFAGGQGDAALFG